MKTALVTGAYKGLGFEWCRSLAKEGYNVILTARELSKAEQAAEKLKREGLVVYPYELDVTNEPRINELVSVVNTKYGQLDFIVNNAGINPKDYANKEKMAKTFYLDKLDAEELLSVIHTNSLAPLVIVKHFHSLLKKSERPVVLNISSWLSSITNLTFGGHYGYIGSKSLLNMLNKIMANELVNDGIICVNVNPGWVITDMGGAKATFTAEEAVANIMNNVVAPLSVNNTGKFFNYDGTEYPW